MPKNYDSTLVRVAGNLLSGVTDALRKEHRQRLSEEASATAIAIRDAVIAQTKEKDTTSAD